MVHVTAYVPESSAQIVARMAGDPQRQLTNQNTPPQERSEERTAENHQ